MATVGVNTDHELCVSWDVSNCDVKGESLVPHGPPLLLQEHRGGGDRGAEGNMAVVHGDLY